MKDGTTKLPQDTPDEELFMPNNNSSCQFKGYKLKILFLKNFTTLNKLHKSNKYTLMKNSENIGVGAGNI